MLRRHFISNALNRCVRTFSTSEGLSNINMKDEAVKAIMKLPGDLRKQFLETNFVYPNTTSIKEEIIKAQRLGVVIYFKDIKKDKLSIVNEIEQNHKFSQIGSKDLNLSMLDLIADFENDTLGFGYMDCIFMQRFNIPTLCLVNENLMKILELEKPLESQHQVDNKKYTILADKASIKYDLGFTENSRGVSIFIDHAESRTRIRNLLKAIEDGAKLAKRSELIFKVIIGTATVVAPFTVALSKYFN